MRKRFSEDGIPDTVVHSNIRTTDSTGSYIEAEAIGIDDGIISYIGDRSGVQDMMNNTTVVIDYSDNSIVPGFIDSHCHAYVSDENRVTDFNPAECKSG